MKTFLIAIALVLGVSACQKSEETSVDPAAEMVPVPAKEEPAVAEAPPVVEEDDVDEESLPVAEDFDDEMSVSISEDNVENALQLLEKELEEDAS